MAKDLFTLPSDDPHSRSDSFASQLADRRKMEKLNSWLRFTSFIAGCGFGLTAFNLVLHRPDVVFVAGTVTVLAAVVWLGILIRRWRLSARLRPHRTDN